MRTTGAPNVFDVPFAVSAPGSGYAVRVASDDVSSAIVSIDGGQILGPSDFHGGDQVFTRTVSLRPSNTLHVELRSKPGSRLTISIVGNDEVPPTITAAATPPANAAGWNNSDVQVRFACGDAQSGIASCPAPQSVTAEGAGQVVAGTATDNAGNTASASVTLNIDKTAPTIAPSIAPAPANGWSNQDVTVSFACSDALSGIAACTAPSTISADGTQAVQGTATDRAANTAAATATVSVDKTPPTITAAVTPPPNAAGWNNGTVTVAFSCADSGSGIAECPASIVVSSEGKGQVVSGTTHDRAGNAASTSVTLNIDTTPATITATPTPAPNAQGWNNTDVTVTFTCSDGLAGAASCPPPVVVTTEGAHQVVTGTAADAAGNAATTTLTLNIDKSRPTITASALPAPNAQGWNDTNVIVSFTCADSLAGIAQCPSSVTVPTEGAGQIVEATAVDHAGNQASTSITLNIDKTSIAIAATVAPTPNAAGWNNTDVTVSFACQDTGAGVGSCAPAQTVTAEGGQQLVTGTATDNAGNSSTASVSVSVDKTPPQIVAALSAQPNAAGWIAQPATVSFTCSDALSGVVSCPSPVALHDGAAQTIAGTATDTAGNTSTASVQVSVDTAPPTITVTINPAPNAAGWLDTDAMIAFACADSGSGIQTCPSPIAVTAEGAGQTFTGTAIDRAGNQATTQVTLNVDKTHAAMTATVTPPPNANGWNNTDVIVTFACTDAGSGVDACPAPVTLTSEGANQVVARTIVDRAGNATDASVTVNIDKSAPTMAASATPSPNAAGWNRTDVVVSFACNDALSGVGACPPPVTVSSEGVGQTISRQVTDRAGNAASASIVLNVDKTPPVVGIASPLAGVTLTTSPATLSGSATDALSGIAAASCNGAPALPGAGGTLTCSATLTDGSNTLTLSATDGAGNVGTSQVPVTLVSNRPPVANAGSGYSGVVGTPLSFSAAASTDPDNDALTYAWTFGDGGSATGASPSHTYANPGSFAIDLTVTDARGATATASTSATIVQPNRAPTAAAGGPYSGVTGTTIQFSGSGSDPDGDPLTYTWNFGDGTTTLGASVSHTYTSAKGYTATLTVSDGQLTATASAPVQVAQPNHPPTVTAGGPYAGTNGASVAFSASASDPDNDALTYSWDFGDGGTGSGASPTHVYAAAGAYTVLVTVGDGHGGTASASVDARIAQANRAPHADAGGPYAGQALTRVLFSAGHSSDPDGDALTYAWDFGDRSTGSGVAPNHGYAAAGTYTAKVTVADGRGGTDTANVAVTIAPAAAVENQPPVARPGGPYSGEANVVVSVNGSGSSDPDADTLAYAWDFGDGGTSSGAAPAHVYASAGVFTITLTVSDGHGHATSATTSATIGAAADRAPPSIALTAPAKVLPGTDVTITASANDNVGVAAVTFTVNGGAPATITAPPYQQVISVPAVTAPGATIQVHATAADAAGNVGVADATLSVDPVPDSEIPVVSLNAPAQATPGTLVRLSATATDNVGVAGVTFSLAGSPIATVPAGPYEATYTIPADALPDTTFTFTARAVDFTGNHAEATATLTVAQNSDTTPPTVNVSAPAGVAAGTSLPITATAQDDTGVAAVSFSVNGVRIASVTQPPYAASFAVPAGTAAGSILHVEARAADFGGLEATATAQSLVSVLDQAVAYGQAIDDSTGRLLDGAAVTLVGTDVNGVPYSASTTTDSRGRFVLRAATGHGVVRVTRDGMTRVDRPIDLQTGSAIEVFDVRLTPLAAAGDPVSGVLGGTVNGSGASLTVPAGSPLGSTAIALTPLSGQGLQGLLPVGWSPVAALDVAPHGAAIGGGTLALPNPQQFAAGASFVLARWDEAAVAWRAVGTATVAGDGATIQGTADTGGAFVALRADAQPSAPPAPNAGDLIAGVTAAAVPADAVSLVTPQPKVLFYAPGVKSDVAGSLTSATPLPSGATVSAHITESYHFFSGADVAPEPFAASLVFYQTSADPAHQVATHVVSPSLDFEPLTLQSGVITVSLFTRDAVTPAPAVGGLGATLTAPTGESLQIPAGATADVLPMQIGGLAAADLGVALPDGIGFVGGAIVNFTGTLAQPATLSVAVPPSLTDTTGLLLARLQQLQGQTKLVLLGVGRVAGNRIVSDVALPGTSITFEGIRLPGRYVFVHPTALTAFAAGTIRGTDNAPFARGAIVSTPTLAIVSLSQPTGAYIAVAVVGAATFDARDPVRSDSASGAVAFANAGDVLPLDLTLQPQAPHVNTVTPSDGSTQVSLETAVVVTFSESIDPATVSGANAGNLVLTAPDGSVVPAAAALTANNAVVTLRPSAPLHTNTAYTVLVAAEVKNPSGYAIGAPFTATFTSLDTAPPLPPPAGSVTASIPVNGQTTVHGTQGTAGAHDQVSIVNLRTGAITPVLLDPNGGFATVVAAGAIDKLRLKIVDAGHNETTLDLPRFSQTNADGSLSVAVGSEGGHVDGPGGLAADVAPGTFPSGAVVTMLPVAETDFPVQLTADQRTLLSYAGGVRLDYGGATPSNYINISIPAGPDDTSDDQWIVSAVTEVNGQQVLNVVDTAKLYNGRIQTSSPPCPGVTGAAVYGIHKSKRPVGLNYGLMYSNGYGGIQTTVAFAPIGPILLPFLVFTPTYPTPICLPSLAGNISVTQNRQRVAIAGDKLSPADREVIITSDDGNGNPVDSHFPKNSVYYNFEVTGKNTDTFTVTVTPAPAGAVQPFTAFRVARSTDTTVLVSMNPDLITTSISKISVTNVTRQIVTEFPQNVVAYTTDVRGGGGSVTAVRVVDANGGVRTVPFDVTSPYGTESLVAKAVQGTIDPTWDQLLLLPTDCTGQPAPCTVRPPGARGVVDVIITESGLGAQEIHVPADQRTDGGFTVKFNGRLADDFVVAQKYADQSGANPTFNSINIPTITLKVSNPVTGQVLKSYVVRAPGAGDLLDIGVITDDVEAPYLVSGPSRPGNFDPGAPLTFTFSESMNPASVQLNMAVRRADGTAVSGHWDLSNGDRSATFVPDGPLKIGESYKVHFNGPPPGLTPGTSNPTWVTDRAGNPMAAFDFALKMFTPHIVSHFQIPDDDFQAAASPPPMAFKDLQIRRKTVAGTLKTTLVAVTGSAHGTKLMTIDATDPAALSVIGRTGSGNYKQRLTLVTDIGLNGNPSLPIGSSGDPYPVGLPIGCTPATARSPFTGDLAITSSFNSYYTYVSFFDVTDQTTPCLIGEKLLTVAPDFISPFNQHGTVKASGYGRGIGVMRSTDGLEAYTAVGEVGAMVVDATKAIPEKFPDYRRAEGMYSADYRDLTVVSDRIVAIDDSGARLDVLDANLNLLASADLAASGRKIAIQRGVGVDSNGDGSITADEIHDLAVIGEVSSGTSGTIEYFDVTNLDAPYQLGSFAIDGLVRDIEIDGDKQRAYVAAGMTASGGDALLVVDLNRITGNVTNNVLFTVPMASAIWGLRLDPQRGLLYVATNTGIDSWAVYDNCCDLGVDTLARPTALPDGERGQLVQREKAALQQAIAAGLAAADAQSCTTADITMLEQGSGACLWDPAGPIVGCGKNPNYQPGLSDHDFEIFFPNMAPSQCVVNALTAQFKDPVTGDRKAIKLPDGSTMVFDDITFFPVSKTQFESAQLDLALPASGGDDQYGDYGLGRQQLLAKWLLEGDYIDVPGRDLHGKDLSQILQLLAISRVEGYEWSVLQENALASSKAFVRFQGASDASSTMHKLWVKQLHSAGKAGIRTALARMIADQQVHDRVMQRMTRDLYRGGDGCIAVDPNVPNPAAWPTKKCGSFEEWVASTAASTLRDAPVLPLFTVAEAQTIHRFFRVKADNERIIDESTADTFISTVAAFIDFTKQNTKPVFDNAGTGPTPDPQFATRQQNVTRALQRTGSIRSATTVPIVPHVWNRGFLTAKGVYVVMWDDQNGGGVAPRIRSQVNLMGGDDQWLDFVHDSNGAVVVDPVTQKAKPLFSVTVNTYTPTTLRPVTFSIDVEEHTMKEANRTNNAFGFYYYVLGTPTSPGTSQPPLPFPANLLQPDTECYDAPLVQITQSIVSNGIEYTDTARLAYGEHAIVRVRVRNLSPSMQTGIQVCSTLVGECRTIATPLAPGDQAAVDFAYTAPTNQSTLVDVSATVSSDALGIAAAPQSRIMTGPSTYQIVEEGIGVNPTCPPSDSTCEVPAEVMQYGTAYRYYKVIDTMSGKAVPNATVTVERTGGTTPGAANYSFVAGSDGILGTGGTPGIALPFDGSTNGDYTVTLTAVNGATVPPVSFTINARPLEISQGIKAGAALKVSGKLLGGQGSLGVGGSLSLSLTSTKESAPQYKGLSVSRAMDAKVGLAFKPDTAKLDVFAGFSFKAEGPSASAGISIGGSVGDKYSFDTFPLTTADKKRMIGLAVDTMVRSQTASLPAAPVWNWLLGALDNQITDFQSAKSSESLSLFAAVSGSAVGASLNLGWGSSSTALHDYSTQVKASLGLEAGVTMTATASGEHQLKKDRWNGSVSLTGELSAQLGLQAGVTREKNTPIFTQDPFIPAAQQADFLTKTFDFLSTLSGGASGEMKASVTLNPNNWAQPDRLDLSFSGKKSWGWALKPGTSGTTLKDATVDNGAGSTYSITYSVTSPAQIQRVLDIRKDLASLVPGLGDGSALIAGPTAFADKFVSIVHTLGEDASYSKSIEIGKGITIPIGFDLSILAEGLGAEAQLNADHSVSYTTEKGVIKKFKQYKLEDYSPTLVPLSSAGDVLAAYTDAISATADTPSAARPVTSTPPSGTTPGSIKSTGSAELRPTTQSDYESVKGLLSFDFTTLAGPVRPRPYHPMDMFGALDKPHYGYGGFHYFAPTEGTLNAPTPLIVDYHDDELPPGTDKTTLGLYKWNDLRNDWDPVAATSDVATNTLTTTVTALGLFTVGPTMPAGVINWSIESSVDINAGQPDATRRVTFVTDPLTMNNGAPVPASTVYHVVSTGPAASLADYTQLGTIITPDLQPAVDGLQVVTGADGRLHVTIEYPAGLADVQLLAFSDIGTANGATVVTLR